MLVEGNSLRATSRMADVSINTVTKLLVDTGTAAADFHDETVRNVRVRRLQCDEIWCFVGAKAKNVTAEQKAQGWGDVWTWTGIDADTKLCVLSGWRTRCAWANDSWKIVPAASVAAYRSRQTDTEHIWKRSKAHSGWIGLRPLSRNLRCAQRDEQRRYSPAKCIGCEMKRVIGNPDPSTSARHYVERQNLTMRMGMRRFTRLTNGFSKKMENHAHMVALHFLHYNFARVHKTLRVTPAMEAGLQDHVW